MGGLYYCINTRSILETKGKKGNAGYSHGENGVCACEEEIKQGEWRCDEKEDRKRKRKKTVR